MNPTDASEPRKALTYRAGHTSALVNLNNSTAILRTQGGGQSETDLDARA